LKSIARELARRVAVGLEQLGLSADPQLRAAQDERFGDYQSNCAMGLAKQAGLKPRDLAEALAQRLDLGDLCSSVKIEGPGFINFRLLPSYVAAQLASVPSAGLNEGDRLGLEPDAAPQVVVIDLSSPNLAKEMHVGHLRSTVIGDCVARVLEFAGHNVYRENHVGDWGTQFGMLLAHLRHVRPDVVERPAALEIKDLEAFYVEAKARFDADEAFQNESRETVVALQQGDAKVRQIWKAFCEESLRHCHAIYDRLAVRLEDRGESYYTTLMDDVVRRLRAMRRPDDAGPVRVSQGALCVFLEGFKTREGDPLPLIVQKSDGGYNYATSDLATIVHRVETLGARRIIYVVGLPQKQHLEMVFAAARKVGWAAADVALEHLGFGSMLNAAGRPFKTREGGTVKLKDLLDEAVARARNVVEAQQAQELSGPSLSPAQVAQIAETVGIAAVKYFDLSHSLTTDYKFDLDTMLALEGNTAPYMLYAYARIRSIGRKAEVEFATLSADSPILLEHPSEIALGKKLVQLGDTIEMVCRDLTPNVLTEYLFELAKTFSRFYDRKLGVRVIDATPEEVRRSRLRLCDLTARALKLGLNLLGIETLEQM